MARLWTKPSVTPGRASLKLLPKSRPTLPNGPAEFAEALSDFRFLPAGRILAGAGTGRNVTLFNCFVMGDDPRRSWPASSPHLREAALTMQQGGGIGYDFSTLAAQGRAGEGRRRRRLGPGVASWTCGTRCAAPS